MESENEKLKEKQSKSKEIMESGELSKITKQDMYYYYLTNCGYLENEIKRQKEFVSKKDKEIKKLKGQIAELEKENSDKYKRIMELEQDLVHADENVFYRECDVALQENKIKTEALKQFAERLKSYIHKCENISNDTDNDLCETIDETLKEFINV